MTVCSCFCVKQIFYSVIIGKMISKSKDTSLEFSIHEKSRGTE